MKPKHTFFLFFLLLNTVIWAKEPSFKERLENDFTIFNLDEVTQRPEFPKGGITAMTRYLAENVKYPASMYGTKISGRVVAEVIVEKDGSLSDIQILKSLGEDFDNEVIRAISEMPKWTPAKIYHKNEMVNVRTKHQISTDFKATQK